MRSASLLDQWTMQEHPLYNMLVIETLASDAHHTEYHPSGALSMCLTLHSSISNSTNLSIFFYSVALKTYLFIKVLQKILQFL